MTVYHGEEKWDVEIIDISSHRIEKKLFGARMYVLGTAKVYDEEGDLLMVVHFNYAGSPGEDPECLHNHIKSLVITHRYNQQQQKSPSTLQNYIEGLIKK